MIEDGLIEFTPISQKYKYNVTAFSTSTRMPLLVSAGPALTHHLQLVSPPLLLPIKSLCHPPVKFPQISLLSSFFGITFPPPPFFFFFNIIHQLEVHPTSMGRFCLHVLLLIFSNSIVSGVYSAGTFTFVNKCAFTVWPGILSNAGIDPLEPTGFSLQTGETKIISAPASWGGRFWGRTQCGLDSTGKFTCVTGDCGSGKLECAGAGAAPPATLAEFTLNGYGGQDFYDVSLVDGYNVPMLLVPQGGSGSNCTKTGCIRDLNSACPSALQVMSSGGDRVACKSACEALGNDEYCCKGAYGTPQSCQPTQYSQLFKSACPQAYSYAYDDSTSTFTCTGADYIVMFCPSPNTSQKASSDGQNGTEQSIDSAMVYQGALDVSGGAPPPTYGGAAVIAAALWLLRHQL